MIEIPSSLSALINGYSWQPITIGHSEASTFLLKGPNSNHYLKMQGNGFIERLSDEKERMEWIDERLPVPRVLFYGEDDSKEYLLMTEVKGVNAADPAHAACLPTMLESIGEKLRTIHRIPIATCPFDQTLDRKIEKAKNRVDSGQVDEDDFDEERIGRKASELYDDLISKRPLHEELVFTHGDFCLPNVLIENSEVSGFIDWGRAGIADKYQDLSLAIRSISSNFGKEFVPFFLSGYGEAEVDMARVHYYQLMDEFF